MKPLVEKLPLAEDASFVARTHRTPQFEVPWHQHVEHELILFVEGAGLSFVGNYIGEFQPGDIFFLGSNLPHTFQKSHEELITSAVVVHFKEDFWGNEFLNLPEATSIKKLLTVATQGLQIYGNCRELLSPLLQNIERQKGMQRLLNLLECLKIVSEHNDYALLSTQDVIPNNSRDQARIDKVFQYTMDHFKEQIELSEVARIAKLSVPAFCTYFKKRTKKNYVNFLNEVRVGNACKLLQSGDHRMVDVCFDSGFNSVANFNRQFLRIKGITPTHYKRSLNSTNGSNLVMLQSESKSTVVRHLS